MKNEKPREFAGATPEVLARALLRPLRKEPQPKPASRRDGAKEAAR